MFPFVRLNYVFVLDDQGANINGVTKNAVSLNLEDNEEGSKKNVKFEGDYLDDDDEDSGSEDEDDGHDEVNKVRSVSVTTPLNDLD